MQNKYNPLAILWQLLQNSGLNMLSQMDVFHLWNSTWVTLISDATDLDGLIFVRQADTLLRPLF